MNIRTCILRTLPAILLLAFAVLRPAAAAEIDVRVDRDPVSVNDSFQIVFETAGDVDDDPDFAPLNKDFKVLSRAQSNEFRMINGQTTRSTSWTLTMLARRTGQLTIPPVAFGKDQSPPYRITVIAGSVPSGADPSGSGSGEVFIEVEAKPLQTWVQAQVIYTVRLFRSVQTSNASLSEPALESGSAVIEKLGEDRSYDSQVMGRPYSVVERSYAIYPQASGTVTVSPVNFQGQSGRLPFSMLDPFGPQPQTLVRQSAPVTLEVQPIPAEFTGSHWLPARQINLTDEWSKEPSEFRVGEPITRTLTLTANGLTASQLPEIPKWVPDGFKSYPDQPALRDGRSAAGILGTRAEKTALIPPRAGEFVLPEIRIEWWDTTSATIEQAILPARAITVLSAAGGQPTGPAGITADEAATEPGSAVETTTLPNEAPAVPFAAAADQRFWQVLSFVLAAGWLLTIFWLSRRQSAAVKVRPPAADKSAAAVRDLQKACAVGDAPGAKEALLRWARFEWPGTPPASIGQIQLLCSGELSGELATLNRALYAPSGGSWDGRGLWRVFVAEQRDRKQTIAVSEERLEPLHRL